MYNKKPKPADDAELTDDVIIRREKGEVVGMAFFNVAKRDPVCSLSKLSWWGVLS